MTAPERPGHSPGVRPRLGVVQETLLIPLYGRAVEHAGPDPALTDPRAVELVEAIDHDFARFDGLPSLTGAVLRTLLFDHWTRDFLDRHPTGTVVEVGTGLNTRFERTDNGRARWFDLDLPDVIALRRAFFADTPRRTTLAASVTEDGWLAEIAHHAGGPHLFTAEAVLPFLDEAQVRDLLRRLSGRLPGALLALDTNTPGLVAAQDEHDALSRVEARLRWGCADIEVVTDWVPGSRVLASHTLTSLPQPVHDALPARHRAMLADLARRRLPAVEEYRMHLVQLP
ncbi:class I SAM-dependent methyltransferase [Streptomyces triticirhizae]|uniref:Class I SAM-dependent methyltransferase n=1 Tax=Streptomyces triticirhizae TaxID=2483353 RepID=A0A3M2L2A9_9ACTN|nr:class I SAM-dependent methyltransferase [Streptomyces triticirhizae]RMI31534.1 class I SAM-dependent methyltransferase [Streptomyces triticirhizae]